MTVSLSPQPLLPDPERSALLVIDVQERLAAAMPASIIASIVRNAALLIKTAHEFSLPVLASEQYPRGLGPTAAEVRSALGQEIEPVEKVAFSCWRAPAFQPLFERLAGRDMILCGIETHVCVLQTAFDLLQAGHRVYIASDATCSRTKHNWRTGLNLLHQAGAVIGSTETFVFSLLGAAGTEQFKRISKLVK